MAHYDHSSTHVTCMSGYEFLLIPGYKTVHLSSNETLGDKRAYVCFKKSLRYRSGSQAYVLSTMGPVIGK